VNDKLSVGFFRFDAYNSPNIGGCAAGVAPGSYKFLTIGGPRTEAQVREEIEACEAGLKRLWEELGYMTAASASESTK
jgi:hypothetical protein